MIAPKRTQRPAKTGPAPTLTVKEFAAISGIGQSTLYRHLRAGTFRGPHFRSGSSYRISKAWADRIVRGDQ